MRSFSQTIRDQIWARLRQIYIRFTKGQNNITLPQVEQFIVQVLGEKNKDDIQYVTNNLSRLDQDGNGFIEFDEFANFLLKQHCGEIALQKMHRNGRILNHSIYKITLEEFNLLLNNAYEFLGVHADPKQTALLFSQADQDRDGLITYVEYFQFVEKFICRPKVRVTQKPSTPTQIIEFNSRFRKFLWQQLIRIFSIYDMNRNGVLGYTECQRLFRNIFKLSEREIQNLLLRIFSNGQTSLTFDDFMTVFITLILGEGIVWHFGNNTHISRDDFIRLLRLTLSFIDIDRVQDILFWRLYDRIDTNRDGLISIDQYRRWIRDFLSVPKYYGSQYISQDDDLTLGIGNNYILTQIARPIISAVTTSIGPPVGSMNVTSKLDSKEVIVRRQVITSGGMNFNPFNFSSQQLALRVRSHLLKLLMRFDANNNRNFEEEEIIQILITLMKEDRHEIMYVIANVFRYDRNNDKRVTYDEMCDFFLQSHCGELAIQRLHKKDVYQRGAEKMMNLEQFIYTLNYALSFIQIQASSQELAILFSQVDRDHDGWITYREYFEFLKYYFGSKSYAAVETTIERIETMPMTQILPVLNQFQIILMNESLDLQQRLRRMLRLHLNKTLDAYDFDGNRMLTSNQIISLLQTLFGYNSSQIQYVMDILKRNPVMKRQQFVDLLLGIHFNEFGFLKQLKLQRIGEFEFARIIELLSSFLSVRFSPEQYILLFRSLGFRNGGYMTITQWEDWISKLFDIYTYRTTRIIQQVDEFNSQIWLQFKRIFAFYDVGNKGYLTQTEIQLFLRQVLLECQHKYRTTILNDLLKLGPVNIQRFASFILGRCAENALHRFHLQQPPGKDRLSEREFILLVQSAYDFLKSISQNIDLIKRSYAKVNTKYHDGIDYKTFIDWAYKDVAKKVY